MPFRRHPVLAVVLLVAAITTAGCHGAARSSTVDVVGCGPARIQRVTVSSSAPRGTAIIDVTADCPAVTDPVERVARTTWFESMPGDAVAIRIRAAGAASPATLVPRAELQRRYGSTYHREDDVGDLLWLVLPLASIVVLVTVLLVARRVARAGVVVVMTAHR